MLWVKIYVCLLYNVIKICLLFLYFSFPNCFSIVFQWFFMFAFPLLQLSQLFFNCFSLVFYVCFSFTSAFPIVFHWFFMFAFPLLQLSQLFFTGFLCLLFLYFSFPNCFSIVYLPPAIPTSRISVHCPNAVDRKNRRTSGHGDHFGAHG